MSGSLRVTARCQVTGPVGDGRATAMTRQWARETSDRLGQRGLELLRAFPMNKSGRATGAFGRELQATRISETSVRIPGPQEKGVVWAPWLEGVSERNATSRFKGYRLFRKTRTQLSREAPDIGRQVLDELMPQIGGD